MSYYLNFLIANWGHFIKIARTKIAIAKTDRRVVNLRLEKFLNRDKGKIIQADIAIIIIFRVHVEGV